MDKLRALVAAAGRGSRAGLPYPKTLHPVKGKPILIRIMELLAPYDARPTVIVSPDGYALVANCLDANGKLAHLVVQPTPLGMGDAVLRFEDSPAFLDAEHVLLLWGDIPLIQPQTVASLVEAHFSHENDLTMATRVVESAYTVVVRDSAGQIEDLRETRESGISEPSPGERDVGLFVFRKQAAFDALRDDVPERFGRATGEHGFLYVVGHMIRKGFRVEGLPMATELDLVSLNALEDLAGYD